MSAWGRGSGTPQEDPGSAQASTSRPFNRSGTVIGQEEGDVTADCRGLSRYGRLRCHAAPHQRAGGPVTAAAKKVAAARVAAASVQGKVSSRTVRCAPSRSTYITFI
ncbi:hypothetical protein J1605_008505 [Eschrichtius robustus]|uniref:Uncharacterized protein n=1 Tax=Eschrichtius robustus TaxID=9764 RepID=A0AB34GZW4_ESCRO|nr:hypothetical protein J1605_008505 [Eschrichtius robustus]